MLNDKVFDSEEIIRAAHEIDHRIMTSDEEGKRAAWIEKVNLLNSLDAEIERLANLRASVAGNPGTQLRLQFQKNSKS